MDSTGRRERRARGVAGHPPARGALLHGVGVLVLLVLSGGAAEPLRAQAPAPLPAAERLPPGLLVRVHREGGAPEVGRVLRAGADTLLLRRRGEVHPVLLSSVRLVERAAGRNRLAGALRGAGYAALLGGIGMGLLVWFGDPDTEYGPRGGSAGHALLGAGVGAVAAVPVGSVVGLVLAPRRWVSLGSQGWSAPAPAAPFR